MLDPEKFEKPLEYSTDSAISISELRLSASFCGARGILEKMENEDPEKRKSIELNVLRPIDEVLAECVKSTIVSEGKPIDPEKIKPILAEAYNLVKQRLEELRSEAK